MKIQRCRNIPEGRPRKNGTPGAPFTAPMSSAEPPRWLWLWFPLLLFALLLVLGVRDDSDTAYSRRWWADYFNAHSEFGFVELATPVAAALGVIAGIAALRHRTRLPTPWLRGWVVLVTLGCVYIGGEETGWGQYFFGWDTPVWWPGSDTDLHSVSPTNPQVHWGSWFNEKPRMLLELFVLYGGIVRVLMQRVVKKGDWFWPTYVCLPSALLAILAGLPDHLDWLGFGYAPLLFDGALINWGRLQELFFPLFLFVYLLSVRYRLRVEGGGSGGHLPERLGRLEDGPGSESDPRLTSPPLAEAGIDKHLAEER